MQKEELILIDSNLSSPFKLIQKGKVRDIYVIEAAASPGKRIVVTTDRISAFDIILGAFPCKGQVLNQLTAWWFDKTKEIIKNNLISVPDPNVQIVKSLKILPIEIIVRGYITGTTDTSLWKLYSSGERNMYGYKFKEGMRKNQKLDQPIVTPTTKSKYGHDTVMTSSDVVALNSATQAQWEIMHEIALQLFHFASEIALKTGLILVDTKYEFGLDENDEIVLADEIHTPDSSRYWMLDTYENKFESNLEPDNLDKEILRLYCKNNNLSYTDHNFAIPNELKIKLRDSYINLYEKLTNNKFLQPESDINDRIKSNLSKLF